MRTSAEQLRTSETAEAVGATAAAECARKQSDERKKANPTRTQMARRVRKATHGPKAEAAAVAEQPRMNTEQREGANATLKRKWGKQLEPEQHSSALTLEPPKNQRRREYFRRDVFDATCKYGNTGDADVSSMT